MNKEVFIMKKVIIICTLLVALGITTGISFFAIRDANAKIPDDATLIDQNGEVYRFGDNEKKVKLIEFLYTFCPDVCPTTTQKMTRLKEDLKAEGVYGDKVEFITITIDPYRDTAAVLNDYMGKFEIENDGNWTFLTGDPKDLKDAHANIRSIADSMKFLYRDPGDGFLVHTSLTYLVDENNKFIEKFPMGEDFNEEEVFATIMKNVE
jgi:protein SCO1